MRRTRSNNKPSGAFLARKALRDTPMCSCGSTMPALITKTIDGKVKGFCTRCV